MVSCDFHREGDPRLDMKASSLTLQDLVTPCLIIDPDRVKKNCDRMLQRARRLGIRLRPHLKTAKAAAVAELATDTHRSITVSTIAEAEYFTAAGYRDILYAVGIAPQKLKTLGHIANRTAADILVLVDNLAVIAEADRAAVLANAKFRVLIEIDSGGGRGGILPTSDALIEIAQELADTANLRLAGVLTHAGHSYGAKSKAEIRDIAETERSAAVSAAARLSAAGYAIDVISVGSTPTALLAESLEGVTEFRPGVYTLFDLDQVGLGTCEIEDIAVSVLATVIGHNRTSEYVLIDAGGLALSKDLSAASLGMDVGYGLVLDERAMPLAGEPKIANVHQEHGFLSSNLAFDALAEQLPIGTRVRILPNHACMTAAAYDKYWVVPADSNVVTCCWDKVAGW